MAKARVRMEVEYFTYAEISSKAKLAYKQSISTDNDVLNLEDIIGVYNENFEMTMDENGDFDIWDNGSHQETLYHDDYLIKGHNGNLFTVDKHDFDSKYEKIVKIRM